MDFSVKSGAWSPALRVLFSIAPPDRSRVSCRVAAGAARPGRSHSRRRGHPRGRLSVAGPQGGPPGFEWLLLDLEVSGRGDDLSRVPQRPESLARPGVTNGMVVHDHTTTGLVDDPQQVLDAAVDGSRTHLLLDVARRAREVEQVRPLAQQ